MATYGPEEFSLRDGRKVLLRHCTGEDSSRFPAFVARIASESTHTLQYVGRPEPEAAQLQARWQSNVGDEVALFLGAFSGDQLVGMMFFHPEMPGHPWLRHIGQFGMMIFKDFWGGGLGKKMLLVIEQHARGVGVSRIEAMVRTSNERGVRLYRSCGYQIEGTRKRGALIDGKYEDEYFLAKILD